MLKNAGGWSYHTIFDSDIINLDFGKLQFGHWAISHLFMWLMNQAAKPPARGRMPFATTAPPSTRQRTGSTGLSASHTKCWMMGFIPFAHGWVWGQCGQPRSGRSASPSVRWAGAPWCPLSSHLGLVWMKSADKSRRAWIPYLSSPLPKRCLGHIMPLVAQES